MTSPPKRGLEPAILLALSFAVQPARVCAADADPWWGPDKALHFGVSTALSAGSYAGSSVLLEEPWQRATFAAGFTLSLGAAKELYDATGHGHPSARDFTWDVIGCAVGVGLAYLIDLALSSDSPRARSPQDPR